jgi:putative PEP-CTERM system TPR-repeat lipoprotein
VRRWPPTPRTQEWLDRAVELAPGDRRALVARGLHHLRRSELAEAVRDLGQALEQYQSLPMSAAEGLLSTTLVQAYLALNRLDDAAATARQFAARAPTAALSDYAEGLVAYGEGRFDEAARLVQRAVNRAPRNPRFLSLLGAVHLALGNLGQAEQQLLAALVEAPDDPAAVRLLAETRLRQRRPDGALAVVGAADRYEGRDPNANHLRGLANLEAGNAGEAVAYLEQAVAADPPNESIAIDLARAYLALGDTDSAGRLLEAVTDAASPHSAAVRSGMTSIRETAERIERDHPNDAAALLAAATLRQLGGDVPEAVRLLERAVGGDRSHVSARLRLAELMGRQGRFQDAERHVREALAVAPDSARAAAALAQLLERQGDADGALRLLADCLAQSPDVDAGLVLARMYLRYGKVMEAAREIARLEQFSRDGAEIGLVRGLVALAEGRFADAASLLAQVRAQIPTRLDATQAHAQALIGMDRAAEAREELRTALRRVPTSIPLRTVLGVAELRAGNPDAAIEIAKALQAEFPAVSNGYLLEAETRLAQRRYDTAADALALAFQRQPSWEVLRHRLAALRLANRSAEVERTLRSWVTSNPSHVPGRLEYAAVLRDAGRTDEAAEQYDLVLAVDSDNVVALNDAAWVYQLMGRSGALALAEKAQRLAPDEPAVLDTLGWILVQQDRAVDGIGYLRKAAELAPQSPDIRYHVAAAHVRLGRVDEAREALRSLLANGAPFAERAAAEALLASL